MKNLLMTINAVALLATFSLNLHAEQIVCKASMMGRVCFDSNGKELTVAEMQAATSEAQRKETAEKVAKK